MDIIKHLEIFDPNSHKEPVAVIGAGATGSATTIQLAKLGLKEIHVYDFDKIVDHNIPNQLLYSMSDVGKKKCEVLARECNRLTGEKSVQAYFQKVDKKVKLRERTIFFCVDTMAARKEIFENSIFLNGNTELLVDMRMNASLAMSFIIDPRNIRQVKQYRQTLYSDAEVAPERGNCGITLSVGSTAGIAANFSVWLFMNWMRNYNRSIFQLTQDIGNRTTVYTPFDTDDDL